MTTAVVKTETQERQIEIQRTEGRTGRALYKFTPPLQSTGYETPIIEVLFGGGRNCHTLLLTYSELRDLLELLSVTVQQFQQDLPPEVV